MAKESKKPAGWRAFDALARKLVKVPKSAVSAERKRKKVKRSK